MTNIHASCLKLKNKGLLILGASGSGKSDLSLRLIMGYGARLVADDRTEIFVKNKKLIASAPKTLKGLLEVRGVGIIKPKTAARIPVDLVIKLTNAPLERLPEPSFEELEGQKVPSIEINPFEISAAEKVLSALSLLCGFKK